MRRREFIAGLGSAAAWPRVVLAQQSQVPEVQVSEVQVPQAQTAVLGLLNGVSFEGPYAAPVTAIRQGVAETGFVEGRNLAIAYRSAQGRYERLPELAADLVRSRATVIVAIGASIAELAAHPTGSPVPTVFAMGSDVVEVGVLDGLSKPQAGVTGISASAGALVKRLDLLFELRPNSPLMGYLDNSRLSGSFESNVESLTASANARGRELAVFDAGTEQEIEVAIAQMALHRIRGLVVGPDPFLTSRQEQIIALAAQSLLPTVFATRGAVAVGGLMSYGTVTSDMYRLAGIYAGQLLKGTTPAESMIAVSPTFALVINNSTAKALRISMPRRLMVRADEIID
jgi:putative ABC transport system substrate-binding protein